MQPELNYRRIALAVILRGLLDLATIPKRGKWKFSSYAVKPKTVEDAKAFFFTDNDKIKLWCDAAGVSVASVARRAYLVLEGKVTKADLDKGYERVVKGDYNAETYVEGESTDEEDRD